MGVGEQGGEPGTDGGEKFKKAGEARGMAEAKEMTTTAMSRRKRATGDPPVRAHDNGAGGKYRAGGTGPEESVDKSAEWSREDMGESESVGEAETAGGMGEVVMT